MTGLLSRARVLSVTLAWFALASVPVLAQQKMLTIDDLFDPVKKVNFGSSYGAPGYSWINDREYIHFKSGSYVRVDAATGTEAKLFDAARLEAALTKLPGVTAAEAARVSRQRDLTFNAEHSALIVSVADDLYYWPFGSEALKRLTSSPEPEDQASFSPDGRLVAFVRGNNLFVTDLGGTERALTTDGGPKILNGVLDWVYEEEIYGRGTRRGYWWSPDSSRLAFLHFDERDVPEFTVVDHLPIHQALETTPYPKAGDPNPRVALGTVRASGGQVRWANVEKYSAADYLIVNVSWTPDGQQLVFEVQDREQTWLDLDITEAAGAQTRTILRETTKAWVDENGSPTWLKDGTFLWFSERNGFKHLYHYKRDGTLVRQVTDGKWEVRTLYGVDEAGGWIYFAGTERTVIGGDLYRVKLDGSKLTRLSQTPGVHSAVFNPSKSLYVGTWSDINTPPQVRLHRADGSELRVIDRNEIPALKEYRLAKPEFLQVTTKDGFVLEAMLIKPLDFDPSKKYPVFEHTYSGPHSQSVRNAWSGVNGLYHQLLAQRGIVVWICDNRSASGKGAESTWAAYKRLGETELADLEECLGWLKSQPWVDSSRIGLDGWSYGGFMTSYALTHSTSWSMGIAGGTVSDFRDYDTVYTERYMRMPQNNPDGYTRTAPRNAASQLHGQLLLIHGAMDDNVHLANTMQLAYELQKAGKPFELMLYPKSRHGVTDPQLVKHLRERMLEFTLRTLKPDNTAAGTK
jgi:dipeptidyl-peptidase 4